MLWLTGTIILAVLGGIAFFVGVAGSKASKDPEAHPSTLDDAKLMRGWGFGIAGTSAFLFLIMTMFLSIHIIPAGHIGVVYGFGGGDIVGRMDNGTNIAPPWRPVKVASIQVKKAEFNLAQGTDAGPAVSSEAQPIFARLTLNYQVDPEDVINLYLHVGPNWFHTLVEGRVLQDFKEITAKYKSVEITPNREQIRTEVRDTLKDEMAKYSITVVDVQLSNLGFPEEFEKAILAKQVQTQRAQEAKAKVLQAQYEGEQALASARSEATANRLLSRSITPNLVRLRSIEKLNPNVQVIYLPTNANLFLPGTGGK